MATILLISPEFWTDHAVSKHHYALTLASEGHTVLFLNPPARRQELTIASAAEAERVQIADAPRVAKGLQHMPAMLRRHLESRWLGRLETTIRRRIDVIWLFENSRFYDMGFAGDRLKIYHQVDLNQGFHPQKAAQSADICFCTTDILREQLLRSSRHVYKIHHGTAKPVVPMELTALQMARFAPRSLNAAYIGNLDMPYLDVELLVATITAHPQIQFHLVGAYKEDSPVRNAGMGLANITWWGKQPSALIPSLLAEMDILICTYQATRHRDQASPHKFMEYFASGKVIVSTYTEEYKDKRHLLQMVDAWDQYLSAFSGVVEKLAEFNSLERQAQRRTFAAENAYSVQLERIRKLVRETVPNKAALLDLVPPTDHAISR